MDYQPTQNSGSANCSTESTMPSASLVVAVAGLFCSFIPFIGTACSSVAVVLALLSRGKETQTKGKSKIALILGILGILIAIVSTIAALTYLASHFDFTKFMDELQQIQLDATYL